MTTPPLTRERVMELRENVVDVWKPFADLHKDNPRLTDGQAIIALADAWLAQSGSVSVKREVLQKMYENACEAMYAKYAGPFIGEIQDALKRALAGKGEG